MPLRFHSDATRIVADIIPFYDEEYYQVFYLKGFTDGSGWSRHQTPWAHIRSVNLTDWELLPNALELGGHAERDGGACFTGSAIRKGSQVHIFYTGFSPGHPEGREQIMHAYSDDAIYFTKNAAFPLNLADSLIYGADEDFRDPFVFLNEDEGLYWMLFTSGDKNPLNGIRRGVIGLAVSTDLLAWEFRPPLYAPRKYPSLECPDLFKIGERWYLLFSQFGRTEYRVSLSPYGPWTSPAIPHFDAGDYFFYAAKTLFDGTRRFLIGWCGELAQGRDAVNAQWGGSFVTPREIIQTSDGELQLVCPKEFLNLFTDQAEISYNHLSPLCGTWTTSADSTSVLSDSCFSSCFLPGEGEGCLINLVITPTALTGSVGVLLRSSDRLEQCYLLHLDLGQQALVLERNFSGESVFGSILEGKRVLCERRLPLHGLSSIPLTVFLKDNILEVFVLGVTLTAPIIDITRGRFGLFASDVSAAFSQIVSI